MAYGGKPVSSKQQAKGNDGNRATPASNPRNFSTNPKSKGNGRPGLSSNKG